MSIPKNHSTFSANSNVSAQDRTEATDSVNRLNFAFDHWNIAEMNEAFSENCIVEHPRAELKDAPQLQNFSTHTNLLLWEFDALPLITSWMQMKTEAYGDLFHCLHTSHAYSRNASAQGQTYARQ
jgi:hypothetical protein